MTKQSEKLAKLYRDWKRAHHQQQHADPCDFTYDADEQTAWDELRDQCEIEYPNGTCPHPECPHR